MTFAEAVRDGLDVAMGLDPSVYVIGLGVPDPKSVFGTTLGLQERYGDRRALDMPTAENGMTGVAIGSAIAGMRPVMVHQRVDFALLAVEQLVNQAAKWRYMFDGQVSVPLVVRVVVGRGWGQGPQHSQSLHSWFAHVPGLKVLMPTTPADAKGLLIAAVEDDDPVIFFEHRWLHGLRGDVPEGAHRVQIGSARIARSGCDVTIVATSYMVVEALHAAELLAGAGVEAEVIDVRSIVPLDRHTIVASVCETGYALVLDSGWLTAGLSGELVASITDGAFDSLRAPPRRLAMPDVPVPTAPALSRFSYPRAADITRAVGELLRSEVAVAIEVDEPEHLDVPDPTFTGPF